MQPNQYITEYPYYEDGRKVGVIFTLFENNHVVKQWIDRWD